MDICVDLTFFTAEAGLRQEADMATGKKDDKTRSGGQCTAPSRATGSQGLDADSGQAAGGMATHREGAKRQK